MNKKNAASPSMILPDLKDPSYWGVSIVQNLLKIVGGLFAALALVIVVVTSFTQLDITVKANASRIEKCVMNQHSYCLQLQITAEQAEQITINMPVRIEVVAEGSYRRRTIAGKVFAIEKNISKNDPLSSHLAHVELDHMNKSDPIPSPTFGLVIVGSQSGWQLLKSSIRTIF